MFIDKPIGQPLLKNVYNRKTAEGHRRREEERFFYKMGIGQPLLKNVHNRKTAEGHRRREEERFF